MVLLGLIIQKRRDWMGKSERGVENLEGAYFVTGL